jgi:hypothetical protein
MDGGKLSDPDSLGASGYFLLIAADSRLPRIHRQIGDIRRNPPRLIFRE